MFYKNLTILLIAALPLFVEAGAPASRGVTGLDNPTIRLYQPGSHVVAFCSPDEDVTAVVNALSPEEGRFALSDIANPCAEGEQMMIWDISYDRKDEDSEGKFAFIHSRVSLFTFLSDSASNDEPRLALLAAWFDSPHSLELPGVLAADITYSLVLTADTRLHKVEMKGAEGTNMSIAVEASNKPDAYKYNASEPGKVPLLFLNNGPDGDLTVVDFALRRDRTNVKGDAVTVEPSDEVDLGHLGLKLRVTAGRSDERNLIVFS